MISTVSEEETIVRISKFLYGSEKQGWKFRDFSVKIYKFELSKLLKFEPSKLVELELLKLQEFELSKLLEF